MALDGSRWNFNYFTGGVNQHYAHEEFTGGTLGSTTDADPSAAIQIHDSILTFLSSYQNCTFYVNGRLNFTGSNTLSRATPQYAGAEYFNRAIFGSGTLTFNFTGSQGNTIVFADIATTGVADHYTGAVLLNSGNAAVRLNQCLGASSYEVRNSWNLINNATGGLDSATSITVRDAASELTLTQAWVNTNAALTVSNGTVHVGNAASSIGTLAGAAGTIQGLGASSALIVNQTADAAYSGVLTQTAGNSLSFIKDGPATLTLGGTNTYAGTTTIRGGVLALAPGATLGSDSNTVAIARGARMQLGDGVNETVHELVLDGFLMPPATYGSSLSSAQVKDNAHFGGSGILTVETGRTLPPGAILTVK
jgi:fibronectin-binding autotransporter adhesin